MRPQVVAHRGASHEIAEHTLGAYIAALDIGADALECDVRLTADGHIVCVHDRTVRRTAQTRGTVSSMELADLSELDFASWKNPWIDLDDEAPDRDEKLDRVLTDDLSKSPDNQQRVRGIAERAQQAGVRSIAGFVQDAASMATLFAAGIDYVQGEFLAAAGPSLDYDFD